MPRESFLSRAQIHFRKLVLPDRDFFFHLPVLVQSEQITSVNTQQQRW